MPPMHAPTKHSVAINGHRTSISLEYAFWRKLNQIAQQREMTRAALITQIDHARPPEVGLATACRLFVLAKSTDSS